MKIILFDGVCNLCNGSVQFIIKHDSKSVFYFTSQQSKLGKKLIKKYRLEQFDSIVLVSDNRVYLYSDAIVEIVKELDSGLKHLYVFRFVPKTLRDKLYKLFAKYRYTIFGKKEYCMIPSKKLQKRFLHIHD